MASKETLQMRNAGFSENFLMTPFGAHPETKKAILAGTFNDCVFPCRVCKKKYVNPSLAHARSLDGYGRPTLVQLHGFCSNRCFARLFKDESAASLGHSSLFAATRKNFYESDEWRRLRYDMLRLRGARCECCGATDTQLHVDHIVPRTLEPWRALDPDNLQILCKDCNFGKGWRDSTDWRKEHRHHPLVDRLKSIRERSKRG